MKLKILHFSLLLAGATTAKAVYVEGAKIDSLGAEAAVPAAKLGVNESANYVYFEDAATDSPGAAAVDPAAKLGVNESASHVRRMAMYTRWYPSNEVVATLSGGASTACEDLDYGAVDPYNDACTDYIGNTHSWCGNYDDDDFTSNTMCCACGGGRLVWGELKDNHVDGCRRGTWGWLNGGCYHCEGDCDRDSDCGDGLSCFQRDGYTPVPGCKGTGKNNWDYCVHGYII